MGRNNMSVNTSGTLLASLFYEQFKCLGHQEGFLLGEVNSCFTDTPQDGDCNIRKEEKIINVQSFLPCQRIGSFYDARGHILKNELGTLLKDCFKSVVGWYRFRRNSSMCVSLRERVIHADLLDLLPDVQPKTFVYALLTASTSSNHATHSADNSFMIYNGRSFSNLPVKVTNLGDTCHSDYVTKSSNPLNVKNSIYNQIVESACRRNVLETDEAAALPGVHAVRDINTSLLSQLEFLSREVIEREASIGMLHGQITELEHKISEREHERAGLLPPASPSMVVPEIDMLIDLSDEASFWEAPPPSESASVISSSNQQDLMTLDNPLTMVTDASDVPKTESLVPTRASTRVLSTQDCTERTRTDPFLHLSDIAKTRVEDIPSKPIGADQPQSRQKFGDAARRTDRAGAMTSVNKDSHQQAKAVADNSCGASSPTF
ncbi:PREDICTED: BRISC complex subunit Abro1-like [Priapulus caudatus]|uniref:BRISC complex subunit Abro1-like n=1 Tax=Priapulus caudatus TaxID=37621 RepID=A0ABM1ENZ2_PRICU|nr:PREDICTED: BRISC complex subunit Abro1-like [Priapulus caudatus]